MAVGVNIVSDFDSKGIKKAISDFKKLEGAGNKATFGLRTFDSALTNGVKNLAKFGAVAGVVAGVIGKNLIDAASNLEESQSKVNVVFGASSKAVTDFASTAAKSMGISKQAALEATGTYGNLLQAFGVAQPKAVEMSTTLVQLAGDLASFNNTSVDEAITALRSGLSGETEPLKRFGVAINDVRLKQEALNMGLYSGTGNLDINAKTQAAYALILKDTSLAQGDYARTSDGVANTQKTLKAQFDDLKSTLGTALIPIYKSLLSVVQDSIMPVMTRFAEIVGTEGIGAGLKYLGGEFLNVIENMGKFGNIMLVLIAAFTAFRLIAIAAAISQNLFNVALLANPIGIAIAAFIAIGVAVVAAYLKFETFRKVVNVVINFVIGYIENMVNLWIKGFNLIISAINILIKAANFFGAGLPELGKIGEVSFGRISTAAQKASAQIFKTIDAIQAAKNAERQGVFYTPATPSTEGGTAAAGGGGGAAKAVETVTEKLKKYIDAIKGVTQAQRSARDATKQVLEANTALSEATQKLSLAQENFNQIIRGYGRDSKQANDKQKLLTKAQRSLEKSGYDVEASIFAVKDAEKKLAEVRADPESNLTNIREAEIALAQAKLNVADATDSQAEATDALTEAQTMLDEVVNGAKVGSDAYTEALEKVNEAKAAQVNASDKVIDALEREKDAVEKLTEAEQKRADAGKGVPAALKRTADAAQEVVDVVTAVVAPVVDAVKAVVETVAVVSSKTAEQVAVDAGYLTQEQAQALEQRRGIRAFASGGIVTKPMMGLVGEAGAEAIIPLDRLGNMGNTYNISVTAGMGADGKDIGTQIVNALKRYERTNGAIPITVA
jgi:hypothetical protein